MQSNYRIRAAIPIVPLRTAAPPCGVCRDLEASPNRNPVAADADEEPRTRERVATRPAQHVQSSTTTASRRGAVVPAVSGAETTAGAVRRRAVAASSPGASLFRPCRQTVTARSPEAEVATRRADARRRPLDSGKSVGHFVGVRRFERRTTRRTIPRYQRGVRTGRAAGSFSSRVDVRWRLIAAAWNCRDAVKKVWPDYKSTRRRAKPVRARSTDNRRLSVVHEYYLVRQSGASQAARRRLASDL